MILHAGVDHAVGVQSLQAAVCGEQGLHPGLRIDVQGREAALQCLPAPHAVAVGDCPLQRKGRAGDIEALPAVAIGAGIGIQIGQIVLGDPPP